MSPTEDQISQSFPLPPPSQLRATRQSIPEAEVVALSGDMALSTVDALREALEGEVLQETAHPLIVDLRDVVYTDSSAWAVLLAVRRELGTRGRSIRVALRAGSQPAKTYQLMGLDRALPLEHALLPDGSGG